MKNIDVDVVTKIMAECVAQEHEIDDMIAYLDAVSVFMPSAADELTNEQVVALDVITKYHQKQRRRLVDSKEKVHERFSYAQADYMELINQDKAKQETEGGNHERKQV